MNGDQQADPDRCGWFTGSMDHPCQQRVSGPSERCHRHPPEDLGDDTPRCGFQKEDGDHCLQPVDVDAAGCEYCYQHPPEEADIPETRGAPEGNDFAEGNPGGPGAEEGNVNAMKYGLHMSAERLMEVMDERQKEVFKHRFMEYRDACMNESQAMALAAGAVLREDLLADLFERRMEEGSFERTVYTDDGHEYEQFTKDDIQALNGFFRELRLGLHYEGNSAQHQSASSSGHGNLDALVQDSDAD